MDPRNFLCNGYTSYTNIIQHIDVTQPTECSP